GQDQPDVGPGSNGHELAPAPGALGLADVDPDDPRAAPLHPVEDPRAALEVDEARLAHRRVGPEENREVAVIEVGNGMDDRAAVKDARGGELVVAVLAAGGEDVSRPDGAREEHRRNLPERVERERIADVERDGVRAVTLQDGRDPRPRLGESHLPGDLPQDPTRPNGGCREPRGMERDLGETRPLGADEAGAHGVRAVRTDPELIPVALDLEPAGRLADPAVGLDRHLPPALTPRA